MEPGQESPPRITAQEQKVLNLVLEGYSNQEVARRLYLSHYTVRDCVSVLLRKFGVHNRVALSLSHKVRHRN